MIIVVNGFPKSGKDEFVKYCIEYLEDKNITGYNTSSVDKIKEIAKLLRWDGEKTPKARKFLSDLKDLYSDYCNGPTLDVIDFHTKNKGITFFHCREPKEIEELVKLKKDTITVLIKRYDTTTCDTNHADIFVEEYPYNYIIENKTDLDTLKQSAKTFIENII
jgi:hypothetical protein